MAGHQRERGLRGHSRRRARELLRGPRVKFELPAIRQHARHRQHELPLRHVHECRAPVGHLTHEFDQVLHYGRRGVRQVRLAAAAKHQGGVHGPHALHQGERPNVCRRARGLGREVGREQLFQERSVEARAVKAVVGCVGGQHEGKCLGARLHGAISQGTRPRSVARVAESQQHGQQVGVEPRVVVGATRNARLLGKARKQREH
mmetsp:Transcript_34897/g.69347  ORF Transcript_34897/g.69347 Transcript_34897/m.69347 type:complete len:204 (-) Transcript_34897:1293-1904(-)